MKILYKHVFAILLMAGGITLSSCVENPPEDTVHRTDVVIYGGTSAAVIAAVSCQRQGKR